MNPNRPTVRGLTSYQSRDVASFVWLSSEGASRFDPPLEQLEQVIAGGYSMAELRTAVELDNLRDDPRVRELIGSP